MFLICAPTGIRTPVVALKGLRPSPLDDGGQQSQKRADFIIAPARGQAFCAICSNSKSKNSVENVVSIGGNGTNTLTPKLDETLQRAVGNAARHAQSE